MDIPGILQEVFEIDAEDIITNGGNDGLTFTVRLTGEKNWVKVRLPKQARKSARDALWEEDPGTYVKVWLEGDVPERVYGRDELVAWLSLLFVTDDGSEISVLPTDKAKKIQWKRAPFGESQTAAPIDGVLLRVMSVGLGRNYGWSLILDQRVIDSKDFGPQPTYETIQEAKKDDLVTDPTNASEVDVGSLLLRYGGGGHKKVGTCQVPVAEADNALQEIIDACK